MYNFVFCSEVLHHTIVTTTMMYKCILCLWLAVSFFYPPVLDRVVSVVLYPADAPLNQAQDGAEMGHFIKQCFRTVSVSIVCLLSKLV